jgi:hypothetical protein
MGIQWEPTGPYAQNQNGIAERSIRTIVSRARTLMLAAPGIPRVLWAETTNTTVHLANRSPTKAIPSGKTPYELFHGSKPTYKHLRTFACAAYALNHQAKKAGKMAPRSEKHWLLDYDATTIYRLWDPVRKRVHISRDMIFNEIELTGNINVKGFP